MTSPSRIKSWARILSDHMTDIEARPINLPRAIEAVREIATEMEREAKTTRPILPDGYSAVSHTALKHWQNAAMSANLPNFAADVASFLPEEPVPVLLSELRAIAASHDPETLLHAFVDAKEREL